MLLQLLHGVLLLLGVAGGGFWWLAAGWRLQEVVVVCQMFAACMHCNCRMPVMSLRMVMVLQASMAELHG